MVFSGLVVSGRSVVGARTFCNLCDMTEHSPKEPEALKGWLLARVGKTVHYRIHGNNWRQHELRDEESAMFLLRVAVSDPGFNHDYYDAPTK